MRNSILRRIIVAGRLVLPISAIVCLMHLLLTPLPKWTFVSFLFGSLLLTLGMGLFTAGADMAIEPMGEAIGSALTKSRKLLLIIPFGFLLGVVVTIAEPDLQVLARQVPSVPDAVLVAAAAAGVGLFLVLSLLRILLRFSLPLTFAVSYALVFLLAAFAAPNFLAVGFDAGGVTTGPITVPFILALGAGISAVRGSKHAEQDSFGMCALCSVGPVLAVLLLERFFDASGVGYAYEPPGAIASVRELLGAYGGELLSALTEAAIVLLPVVAIFAMLQIVGRRLPRGQLTRIAVGLGYTLVGLTVFLAGVNLGFLPVGTHIGRALALSKHRWALFPFSAVIGFFVVYAEPAVQILNKQVEDITGGAISSRIMMTGISLGVAIALVLSVVRILYNLSIWAFLLPGYALALALTAFAPRIFTAIAFDSGGVSAGTMTAAFLLPFAVGVCEAVGGNVTTDAFGVVALVAMMPLISMQLLGVAYQMRLKRVRAREAAGALDEDAAFSEELVRSELDIDAYVSEYGAIPEREGDWKQPKREEDQKKPERAELGAEPADGGGSALGENNPHEPADEGGESK